MCLLYLPLNKNKVTINNRLQIIKISSISNNIYTKYVVYFFLKKTNVKMLVLVFIRINWHGIIFTLVKKYTFLDCFINTFKPVKCFKLNYIDQIDCCNIVYLLIVQSKWGPISFQLGNHIIIKNNRKVNLLKTQDTGNTGKGLCLTITICYWVVPVSCAEVDLKKLLRHAGNLHRI